MGSYSFSPLQHAGVDFTEQVQQTTGSRDHSLILTLPVLDEITQKILFHRPWLPATDLTDRVETRRDDLATNTGVHEFLRNFVHDGGHRIWWRVFVHGLGERDENRGDTQLVVRQVLDDVCVEAQNTELVTAHDSREQLHHEDFVVEREPLVVFVEDVVELLGEGLWIVEQLQGREVGGRYL